jgi:hypothetical protein
MVIRTSDDDKSIINFTKISGLLILMETYNRSSRGLTHLGQ